MDLNMLTPRKPIGARHKSRPHAHAKCKTKEEALARLQEIKSDRDFALAAVMEHAGDLRCLVQELKCLLPINLYEDE